MEALGCPAGLLADHRSTCCVTSGRAFQHHSVRSRFLAAERGCKTAHHRGPRGGRLGAGSVRRGGRAREPEPPECGRLAV